jgi:DNA mismatch repair protein MutS2
MEEDILNFIESKNISPFSDRKTALKPQRNIFKTADARTVATKFIQHLASSFTFAETSNIFSVFEPTDSLVEIKKRQEFFKQIQGVSNSCLDKIENSKTKWRIPYTLIATTENEETFMELKARGAPVRLILSESDIVSLEQYDLVYCIDCEEYSRALEEVTGAIFVSSIDEVYLEKNLVELSGWKNILKILLEEKNLPSKMQELTHRANSIFSVFEENSGEKIDRLVVEKALENINKNIESRLQSLTISGSQMVTMMQRGALPQQISTIINEEIAKTNLPSVFFSKALPVQLDEEEIEKALRKQTSSSSTRFAKKILKEKETLKRIPGLLKLLSNYLLYLDFAGGINEKANKFQSFPEIGDELVIEEARNKLLDNPQKVSFHLTTEHKCSILTGANSGGKTTLLEHIIHIIVETQLGLPSENKLKVPLFSEVYYFAKNKGSSSKGAFETLLTELSTIKPGKQTLILADEVEAVTEPGVAGEIMKATIEYFIPQGCFMVLATHLGKELQHDLPKGARIDGIEATGLDEQFNLIVNHNPVLGRLARSTPELIVEKMAKSKNNDYLTHLFRELKKPQH